MREPFIGSEALARGLVTRHELARWYETELPNVYFTRNRTLDFDDRIRATSLWAGPGGVIAGVAASAVYGADWVDVDHPVEVIGRHGRVPDGVVVRNDTLAPGEVTRVRGLFVTSPARTAFDLGRLLPRDDAVARLDALLAVVPSALRRIESVIDAHPGVRGVRRLPVALDLADGGSESPKETWLRLLLVDAGLPRPTTQLRVFDGRRPIRRLDMGWEEYRIGVEYDGEQHRTDRRQYVKDVRSKRALARLGWRSLNVVKEDDPEDVVGWARHALTARGWAS